MNEINHHEMASIFPMMTDKELSVLADDIKTNGLQNPIILHGGKILDGRNRYEACRIAGVDPKFVEYAGDDPFRFIISLNLHRRHLDESQRAVVAARVANMTQGTRTDLEPSADLRKVISQPEAARLFNVSERMIQTVKAIEREAPERIADIESGKMTANHVYNLIKSPHVSFNSGDNEWYTPPEYIEAARKVMGSIDLDPASSEIANRIVKAKTYFTAEQNGLIQWWSGNVWMNPPYAQPLIASFCNVLSNALQSGTVKQAISLVNNATETAWFRTLIDGASAVIFTAGRIRFLDPQGNPGAPLQGQAIIYSGDKPQAFIEEFGKFGWGALLP